MFLFCIYKTYLISAERYQNAEVGFLRVTKTDDIWLSMKNIHDGLGLNIVSDLVLKEIYGKYGRKNFADGEIKKHKMTEREVFKNYDNLSENELNSKNNKEVYVRNDVITCVTVHYRGKKKREQKNRWIQKKIRVYRSWYYGTQWILNQIRNRKNVCKWKNIWRILCQNLWNWSLFL